MELDGGAAWSPIRIGYTRAREERERVRVSARESARPRCLQRYLDHGVDLAPVYGSHAAATACGQSATTPADSELHWVTDSATSCTCNS